MYRMAWSILTLLFCGLMVLSPGVGSQQIQPRNQAPTAPYPRQPAPPQQPPAQQPPVHQPPPVQQPPAQQPPAAQQRPMQPPHQQPMHAMPPPMESPRYYHYPRNAVPVQPYPRMAPWGGDIHHFHTHDFPRWRSGYWYHGFYGNRSGWWWVVGPSFYFYSVPVYPYPNPYVPSEMNDSGAYSSDTTSSPDESAPASDETPQNWYYCESAQNYYPYVEQCPEGWKTVPAKPEGE